MSSSLSYSFGPFVLTPGQQRLTCDGQRVRLGGRALDLLNLLVQRPGEVVSKADLINAAWPTTFVDEANLKVNMSSLRRLLGGGAEGEYIATVIGRGYRFIAPVTAAFPSDSIASDEEKAAPQRRHNLPFSTTRVFGRDQTAVAVRADLEASRLVTIVGPGGIGKTTVALGVAEELLPEYNDGIWLVELSSLEDPTLLPAVIATTLGLMPDTPNVLAAVCDHLRDRQALILLDSCEHLIERTADCVSSILAAAGGVRVLATSREQLRTRGERVRRLVGLETPPTAEGLKPTDALQFPSVQLLVDRVSEQLETYQLTDYDAPEIARICQRLEGHALAIELAASRVPAFGARGVLTQLDDYLDFTPAQRGAPARHQTLTSTIEWSYRLLTQKECAVLRRLAAFAGFFDLEAATAIAADAEIQRLDIVEALASLVDKSLVAAEIRNDGVQYRLWDATRSYGFRKLTDSGELHSVRHRHASHFLQLLDNRAHADLDLTHSEWLARNAHQLGDVRIAIKWALSEPANTGIGIALTVAAISLWKRLSLVEECRAAVELALEDRFASQRTPRQELILQLTLGATLLDLQGTLPEVKITLQRALALAVSLKDRPMQLACLRGLSEFELWSGDSHAALALATEIRALGGDGDQAAATSAHAGEGTALEWLGDLTGARQHLEQALKTQRPVATSSSDRFVFNQRLVTLASMTMVHWLQGFADQALATAETMRSEAEASGYAWSHCYALYQSSTLALHVRDYDAGKRFMDRADEHAARHGLTFWRLMSTAGMRCRWQLYVGEPIDIDALSVSLAAMEERGSRMYYPHLLTNFGEAVARQGDLKAGLAAIDRAIELCEQTGQVVVIPEILRIKGNVLRFEDPQNWKAASDCYRRAAAMAHGNTPAWELRALISLVKLHRINQEDLEAEAQLVRSHGGFSEGFQTGDLLRARALIQAATGAPGSALQTHQAARSGASPK